jgi:metallo-beta-lactamase family protein
VAFLTFLGAARTVTGSEYLLESETSRILVDCGMFQGDKALRLKNWAEPGFDPSSLSALIVTHTHMDHIGRIPRLVKAGYRGRILCTPPTRPLAEILLKDAAHLQMEDAEYLNRKGLTSHTPALPLFDEADVAQSLARFEAVAFHEAVRLSPNLSFSFRDAGHLLGAASVDLTIQGPKKETRILFSGDVGRFGAVLTKDPELAPDADYLVVESTYGNRSHDTMPVQDQLEGVLKRTFSRGGVVLIPAFAVGRAQQMLVLLDQLVTEGRLRPFPVHLDSPMAVDVTQIYEAFPEEHGMSLVAKDGSNVLQNPSVHLHRTVAESKALNSLRGPAVILSSSGMLTGGRILHHCSVRLPRPENTLLITGYQGVGTLGRSLLEGAHKVRIHKTEIPVLAQVAELRGLSGHGDAGEMLRWLSGIRTPPRRIYLTHGEEEAARALAGRITTERGFPTYVPELGERVDLG